MRAGPLIREKRDQVGITRSKLCAEIGMTLGQLSDIERGIQTVSLRRAFQIAEVLKVPFDDVVSEILRDKLYEAGFREVELTVVLHMPHEANGAELGLVESDDKLQV